MNQTNHKKQLIKTQTQVLNSQLIWNNTQCQAKLMLERQKKNQIYWRVIMVQLRKKQSQEENTRQSKTTPH